MARKGSPNWEMRASGHNSIRGVFYRLMMIYFKCGVRIITIYTPVLSLPHLRA